MGQEATAVRQQDNEEFDETGLSEVDKELQRQAQIQIFGSGLQTKFDRDVGLKEEIEQRWLDDLRHYNGRYDRDTEAKMASSDGAGKDKKNFFKTFSYCIEGREKQADTAYGKKSRQQGHRAKEDEDLKYKAGQAFRRFMALFRRKRKRGSFKNSLR